MHQQYRGLHQDRQFAACGHGQPVGSAGLPHRADAVRRHQGFGAGVQGGRAGGGEEFYELEDDYAAVGVKHDWRFTPTAGLLPSPACGRGAGGEGRRWQERRP
ncbi:hypothetical protein CBM2623_B140099 [Cupriavidus taiwanensis]|nr:hypothetical protein CBM2608_B130226 [Cupriavidus taiwanensis]SPA32327.1 hypothetical protein CBM2623_B140099 [Cupriavidus taiwanensis]